LIEAKLTGKCRSAISTSSVQVKNTWRYNSAPPNVGISQCLDTIQLYSIANLTIQNSGYNGLEIKQKIILNNFRIAIYETERKQRRRYQLTVLCSGVVLATGARPRSRAVSRRADKLTCDRGIIYHTEGQERPHYSSRRTVLFYTKERGWRSQRTVRIN